MNSGGAESYSVTVERGTDGTYLAWVDDLPGCAVRARSWAELLTDEDWARMRRLLTRSRAELLDLLGRLTDEELDSTRDGTERTLREEIEHIGFVELMYALWTFDLRSREGLAEFLAWTREVADARLQHLAGRGAADLTSADWAGAPRLESWTPRKAARRLVWHELLHLRAIELHRSAR